mgnify:CR=1 FL=1
MKKSIITLVFLFTLCVTYAQKVTINGNVTAKENNEALFSTAITVFDAKTNTYLNYAYTDENGNYTISINKTSFYIKAELLGYKDFKSEVISTNKDNFTKNIVLEEDATVLEEVLVLLDETLLFGGLKL